MGIPSFYRHLCRKYPNIITSTIVRPAWLCLDFNCAMYHVLRTMEPYKTETNAVWERTFRKRICKYLEEIVDKVIPIAGIYVACDGVVCAAKRRQQRLRRFKGPYLAALENKENKDGWDQNALTPGSDFMASLAKDLVKTGSALQKSMGIPVIMSTTEEPGEGEHKIMFHMRGLPEPATCMIYGLDADLVLLAMLLVSERGQSVHLLREAQEFEPATGWRTVDIPALQSVLLKSIQHTDDFVAAMSLLGNDFIPKSLTHTVRGDGIPKLIENLEGLWSKGKSLVVDGSIDPTSLQLIVKQLASEEEYLFMTYRNKSGKMLELYKDYRLKSNWQNIYTEWCNPDPSEYLAGIAWVFDYYKGRPVDLGWFYEPHLPPLFSLLGSNISPPPLRYTTYLPSWIHLLAVLPEKSARHLLKKSKLGLIKKHPEFWPDQFSLFDIGTTQLWQTEPLIPIIPEAVLRDLWQKLD